MLLLQKSFSPIYDNVASLATRSILPIFLGKPLFVVVLLLLFARFKDLNRSSKKIKVLGNFEYALLELDLL